MDEPSLPDTSSQINQVISQAIKTFITRDNGDAYREIYRKYMGVTPRYLPDCSGYGGWVPDEEIGPELMSVLVKGMLMLGYVDEAPYVFNKPDTETLHGLDADLAAELTTIISKQYTHLAPRPLRHFWVEVKTSGTGGDAEAEKFAALYKGLEDALFDVAMAGQLVLPSSSMPPGATPEWACASAMLFPAINYTGLEHLPIPSPPPQDRTSFVEFMREYIDTPSAKTPVTFFSVVNPGPSPGAAQDLVTTINRGKGKSPGEAVWGPGDVVDTPEIIKGYRYHFMVGDSIASAYQYFSAHGKGGLDIPSVDSPSTEYNPIVRSATLLALCPFTIKR